MRTHASCFQFGYLYLIHLSISSFTIAWIDTPISVLQSIYLVHPPINQSPQRYHPPIHQSTYRLIHSMDRWEPPSSYRSIHLPIYHPINLSIHLPTQSSKPFVDASICPPFNQQILQSTHRSVQSFTHLSILTTHLYSRTDIYT